MAGNKVLIFYTENEGKKNETVHFKLVDIEQDWLIIYKRLKIAFYSTQSEYFIFLCYYLSLSNFIKLYFHISHN